MRQSKDRMAKKPCRLDAFSGLQFTQTTQKFLKSMPRRGVNGALVIDQLLNRKSKQDRDTYLWGMEVGIFDRTPIDQMDPPPCRGSGHLAKLVRDVLLSSSMKAPRSGAFHHRRGPFASRGRKAPKACSPSWLNAPDNSGPGFSNARNFDYRKEVTSVLLVGPGHGIAPFRAFVTGAHATGQKEKLAFLRIAPNTAILLTDDAFAKMKATDF